MKKLIALVLALVMVCALCACGGGSKDEPAPAAAPAAPAAAPADGAVPPPEGEASGEGSGEPVERFEPTKDYSKDFAGYKEYAIDALESDEHAPPDILEMTKASMEQAEEGDMSSFQMMIDNNRIMSYDEFIAG